MYDQILTPFEVEDRLAELSAWFGVPVSDIFVPRWGGLPLFLPTYEGHGPRRYNGVKPEMTAHPALWLADDLAYPREDESLERWSVRVWLTLCATSWANPDTFETGNPLHSFEGAEDPLEMDPELVDIISKWLSREQENAILESVVVGDLSDSDAADIAVLEQEAEDTWRALSNGVIRHDEKFMAQYAGHIEKEGRALAKHYDSTARAGVSLFANLVVLVAEGLPTWDAWTDEFGEGLSLEFVDLPEVRSAEKAARKLLRS